MIFVTNSLGKATYLSHEWTALTGQRLADAVDFGWSRVVHADDVAIVRGVVAGAIAGRSEFSVRYRLLTPEGRAIWVAAGAVPSFGPPGRTFLGFFGSITRLAAPPAEGAVATGSLGRFDRPAPDPHSLLEQVADHLIQAHVLIMQDGGAGALAPVEAALHAVGRALAKAAEASRDGSILH